MDKFELGYKANQKGRLLEQQGEINRAISYYEKAICYEFEGNSPYDRLVIIYKKQKRYDDIERVLLKAIDVFTNLSVTSPRADVPVKLAKFKEKYDKLKK